jgi:hypothetical protein
LWLLVLVACEDGEVSSASGGRNPIRVVRLAVSVGKGWCLLRVCRGPVGRQLRGSCRYESIGVWLLVTLVGWVHIPAPLAGVRRGRLLHPSSSHAACWLLCSHLGHPDSNALSIDPMGIITCRPMTRTCIGPPLSGLLASNYLLSPCWTGVYQCLW